MLPLLSERLGHQADFQVYIMQGVQHRKDVLYANDFLQWAAQFPTQVHYRTYLSREDLSQNRASYEYPGYVQSSFDQLTLVPEVEVVYLCGNPNMIDQTFVKLQNLGLTTSQIRREKYISSK